MKVGDTISNYLVVSFSHKVGRNPYYNCMCINCGSYSQRAKSNLYAKKKALRRGYCHNCKSDKHPLYSTWKSMISRCNNPNNSSYKYYGGRGIRVCKDWENSFWAFVEDVGEKPEGKTLDRIDNNLGYNKGNCRWATPEEQMNNKRSNVSIPYRGGFVTESELARISGVNRTSIQARRRRGVVKGEDLIDGLV